MKRAIYVGEPQYYRYAYPPRHPLHYGMTGEVRVNLAGFLIFIPDGEEQRLGRFLFRQDIYIPSEDATRYCPKPALDAARKSE